MSGGKRYQSYSADLTYDLWLGKNIVNCVHCNEPEATHYGSKCLFEPTLFKSKELLLFFQKLLAEGGVLVLKNGKQSFTQEIAASVISQSDIKASVKLKTKGTGLLEDLNA